MPDSVENIRRSRKTIVAPTGRGTKAEKGSAADPSPDTEKSSFDQVLAGVSGRPSEKRLEVILGEIKELSAILARRRLLEDLESFRRKVGEFLRVYMDEVLVVRETGGRRGSLRKKQMIVVKKVDVELDELSKMVKGGASDFRILKELGTIEGLLMDLYR